MTDHSLEPPEAGRAWWMSPFSYFGGRRMDLHARLIGASEGTTVSHVDWMATPHFYRRGSLIVLYVGDDVATLQLLRDVAGPQFAGGT